MSRTSARVLRAPRTVTFWYRPQGGQYKIVIGVRECKQPEQTREWKRLEALTDYSNLGWAVGTPEEVFLTNEFKYENK
jgi:hypothetical protein